MRIALDATYSIDPHPSGIAVYSRRLLDGLASFRKSDGFVHCFRPKQFLRRPAAHPPNVWQRPLLSHVPTFRADLFHALNQRVDWRPAKKVVATFHDLFVMTGDYSSPEFRRRFAAQAQRAAANSDLVIAVSQFTAGQVSALLKIEPSRIRVIPHGVDLPPNPLSTPRENLILSVGALQIRKNTARLVEAFEFLPNNWQLVLAGAPTGYGAAAILRRIESSPCRTRIQVTGYLPQAELERLYARAAIFAFPSLDEGFGIPVLEAMAHGIPVVTSNRSALPEVAGQVALLLNPESTAEITAALLDLAADSSKRERFAFLGRQRAESYPWQRAVDATYAAYREL